MEQILFISLGCDKNLVDSEVMLGLLADAGYMMTDSEEEADAIVINTCCFIGDAKEESIDTILEMARYRQEGRCRALIVTGCMAERYQNEILEEIPEVDAILGTTSYDKIVDALKEAFAGSHPVIMKDIDVSPDVKTKRLVTTGGHYAFLKIAEGCGKHCTYCIIPKVRGHYRSFPMEQLLREASVLAEGGVKELILVAQETTLYGTDLYGKKKLPELLRGLCRIPGIEWIRIQYCYPEEITSELIQVIREEPKICHYLDMPIQHINNDILRRMGRQTTKEELVSRIREIRQAIPDIALRTTLISGFPGESEEQHKELLDFVEETRFDRLGVFPYSIEEDTPAAEFPNQIPEEVKQARRDEIMELQQAICAERSEELVGSELMVMIEGRVVDENAYVGRTYRDAPGVDGYIFVNTDIELMSGDFVQAIVTGASEYDLIGDLKEE